MAFSLPHFGCFTAGESTRAAFHLSPQGQNTIISVLINIPPEADSETRIQVQVDYLHLIAIHMNRAVGKGDRVGKKASSHCGQLCNPLNPLGALGASVEDASGPSHVGRMGLGDLRDRSHQMLAFPSDVGAGCLARKW